MTNNKLQHEFDTNHFRVAIFGSARIDPKYPQYQLIERLAKMIAKEGIDIVTGGGPGIMEAANKGHQEGRGKNGDSHSVGLNILLTRETAAVNKHLDIKREFHRFSERLDTFMALSNVVVVAPGGIGTLLEFFYAWQLVQVKHICNTPIILLGQMWAELIEWVEKWPLRTNFLDPEDINTLFLADTLEDAMKVINMAHDEFKKGGKDFCLNYKKYRIG